MHTFFFDSACTSIKAALVFVVDAKVLFPVSYSFICQLDAIKMRQLFRLYAENEGVNNISDGIGDINLKLPQTCAQTDLY